MSTCMPAGTVIFGDFATHLGLGGVWLVQRQSRAIKGDHTLGLEVSGWSSVSSTSTCPYLMREAIRGVQSAIKRPSNGHQAQSRALQVQSGAIHLLEQPAQGHVSLTDEVVRREKVPVMHLCVV